MSDPIIAPAPLCPEPGDPTIVALRFATSDEAHEFYEWWRTTGAVAWERPHHAWYGDLVARVNEGP